MSGIREKLNEDMKQAMRDKDKETLSTIRMALAAIKQKEIDERNIITDTDVINIISKMIKQRKDSYEQFQQAARSELAEKEAFEISILSKYLPKPYTIDELTNLIKETVANIGANSMKDMGKVMASLKPKVLGKADMTDVSKILKSCLI
jgi:uncharacterized protein YqeY